MKTIKTLQLVFEGLADGWLVQRRGMPDGWSPVGVEIDGNTLLVHALVDTEAPLEMETFRIVKAGDDLGALVEREQIDPHLVGWAQGLFLFVDCPLPEEGPQREVTRPDLESD